MSLPEMPPPSDDARFPSGPWTGFFVQPTVGRSQMELHLMFVNGEIKGEGRDRVGAFLIKGKFQIEDGRCWWTKAYIGLHDVHYQGYNEGKGIWGMWEIEAPWRGGFHIWPEGMADPTKPRNSVEEDIPFVSEYDDALSEADATLVTVGS